MFSLGNADKNMLVTKQEENKYYDKNITIDINDKNNTHSIIASSIKKNSIVLDVGCGAGYTGKLLSEKKCEVYGIDLDKEALKVSEELGCYKELLNISITDYDSKEYKNFINKNIGKFDYIVFADILEHVVEPGNIIANFLKLLKKDGKFLISVPNVAHVDILKELTNRRFNYNKIGILDNTHLRFFTKNSFYEFIEGINNTYQLNLGIKLIGKTISEPWYINEYPEILKLLNEDEEICVLQYVYEIDQKGDSLKEQEYNDNFLKIEYELRDLKNNIQNLNEEKRVLEDKNKNNTKEIKKLNTEIKNLNKQNEQLACELENYKIEINKILNSKSWKITKPLRGVSKIIKSK